MDNDALLKASVLFWSLNFNTEKTQSKGGWDRHQANVDVNQNHTQLEFSSTIASSHSTRSSQVGKEAVSKQEVERSRGVAGNRKWEAGVTSLWLLTKNCKWLADWSMAHLGGQNGRLYQAAYGIPNLCNRKHSMLLENYYMQVWTNLCYRLHASIQL